METKSTIRNTTAYIQSWLRALQNDTRMLVSAASKADKAIGLIVGVEAKTEAQDSSDEAKPVMLQREDKPKTVKPTPALPATPTPTPEPKRVAYTAATQAAAKKFAARCQHVYGSNAAALAGAYLHEGVQYIVDGHVGVRYHQPIPGLPEASERSVEKYASVRAHFENAKAGKLISLPCLQEIKAQYKQACEGEKGFKQYTKLDSAYVNTSFLIAAMELIDMKEGNIRFTGETQALILYGNGCEAIVLPIRAANAASLNVWEPEIA